MISHLSPDWKVLWKYMLSLSLVLNFSQVACRENKLWSFKGDILAIWDWFQVTTYRSETALETAGVAIIAGDTCKGNSRDILEVYSKPYSLYGLKNTVEQFTPEALNLIRGE